VSRTKSGQNAQFDPLAYIESAFSDTKLDPSAERIQSGPANAIKEDPEAPSSSSPLKFRKRQLSAPRPRKVRRSEPVIAPVDPELEEIWQSLPRNIHFLASFFDDSVTANYYRGEFEESREDLIRRLLDPELTLEEVSRLLGVCPATVRRYTNRGWLKHHRTKGGQRRFRLSGVVKFVEHHGRHAEA